MTNNIKIILFRSLAYTGTTWANLVAGSNTESFVLGPPDRIWKMTRDQASTACLVHGADCDFWPDFLANYDREVSFIEQLSDLSGKSCIVINNPSASFLEQEINGRGYDVRVIKFVRDGRANTYSMMRHHPERYDSFYDAVRGWYLPAIRRLEDRIPADTEQLLLLQYESLVQNWREELSRLADFTDTPITEDSIRYWEYGHHLTAANSGVVETLRMLQGLRDVSQSRSEFYRSVLDSARNRNGIPVLDDEWRRHLTETDDAAYDFLAGPEHVALGYSPIFPSDVAKADFRTTYNPPEDREEAIRTAPDWRNRNVQQRGLLRSSSLAASRMHHWLRRICGACKI